VAWDDTPPVSESAFREMTDRIIRDACARFRLPAALINGHNPES